MPSLGLKDLARPHLCSPHEPQLEDVHMASTLQRLVSGVVGQVVMLVLLEQVAGVHLVAVLHQTLREETRTRSGRTRGNTHTHGVRQSCSTSSLTSRAEHCRGTDIILCGFQVTELALKATQMMDLKAFIWVIWLVFFLFLINLAFQLRPASTCVSWT